MALPLETPAAQVPISAVILTGGRDLHNPLLAGSGVNSKVLLPVYGKPMLVWLYDTLAKSSYKPPIFLSTQDPEIEALEFSGPRKIVSNEDKAVGSFFRALHEVDTDRWVLLVSGDHVLLTPEMVDYFIRECLERDLVLGAAVVGRQTVNREYPNSKRTYFHAKGESYSGGNMYLVNKHLFIGNQKVMETIDNNRKKPWKSVFMLDPWTMLKILTRQLTMHQVADVASKLIGCKSGVVEMPFAECCMDVDKQSDLEIAEGILAKRAAAKPTLVATPS